MKLCPVQLLLQAAYASDSLVAWIPLNITQKLSWQENSPKGTKKHTLQGLIHLSCTVFLFPD